jgi:hypothetical protein
MYYSREKKIELVKLLNWDYAVSAEDMLAVIEGRLEKAPPFDRPFLFVRSLERLPWHYIVALWGIDAIQELYTPRVAARVWPPGMRSRYDYAVKLLRGEAVSSTGWSPERREELRHTVLSHWRHGN